MEVKIKIQLPPSLEKRNKFIQLKFSVLGCVFAYEFLSRSLSLFLFVDCSKKRNICRP